MKTEQNILVFPVVWLNNNDMLKEQNANGLKNMQKLYEQGFIVSHMSSATLDNAIFNTYIMEKNYGELE